MFHLRCVLLVALACLAVTESKCLPGWEKYDESCYTVGPTGLNFKEAKKWCSKKQGAHVTEIRSEGENEFVKDMLRRDGGATFTEAWIGVWETHFSEWRYVLINEYPTFTDWSSEDNPTFKKGCAAMTQSNDWMWDKLSCFKRDEKRAVVCESSPLVDGGCLDGSCYTLMNSEATSVKGAQALCGEIGGYALEIHSKEEQDFVQRFLDGVWEIPEHIWLGANDSNSEGEFIWMSGKGDFDYTFWADGEPNNADVWGVHNPNGEDCIIMDNNKAWKWNDGLCKHLENVGVVCETPEDEAN